MKRNRIVVILVAIAMSMVVVQGAFAENMVQVPDPEVAAAQEAEIERGELLRSIEANPFTVVDDLVNRFASDDATAEQLRATLDSASATKLAGIAQSAESLEDVAKILTGKTTEELAEVILIGEHDRNFVYTPVRPCRIVDTRATVDGAIPTGRFRDFYVYGSAATISAQGGYEYGCPSPRGEPRAVHINVTAVGATASGNGNLGVYPANIKPVGTSLINYRRGTNIANAATVQTYWDIMSREIIVRSEYASTDVVIDVLGYYHDAEPEKAVAAGSTGTLTDSVSVGTWGSTLATKTVTFPSSGSVILMGEASLDNDGDNNRYFTCRFFENGTSVDYWTWDSGDSDEHMDLHQSRFYMKKVSAGTNTYELSCSKISGIGSIRAGFRNLTVLFVREDI